ncbi:MAG: amidohydrolase [Bacteroidetes bacterium]|nr:amidohydrolase [Bacteroidota bacterium]
MLQEIRRLTDVFFNELIEIRRHLHAHPELSKQEFRTAEYIAGLLKQWGIEYQDGIAGTGVVGLIRGKEPHSRNIALRADMDALPIREKNDLPYKSLNPGVMHACGHDVHMTCLLGTARILQEIRHSFTGSVRLIFQPTEESYPGGAKPMIEAGVLKNPDSALILGQHVYPELEAGKIGLKAGKYMASTDEIFLTVKGRGGHAAVPDRLIDPVLIAAHIVVALQQIVSRNASPVIPTVLSFGRIHSEGRTNIVPDEVKIEGIMRTFNEEWREEIKQRIRHMASTMAEAMGGSCDVFIDPGYPFLVNDETLTQKVKERAVEYLGKDNVADLEMRMTAEDFAYFAREIPGCFYRLGIRNESQGIVSNLHSATFNVDEESIRTGTGLMAWLAFSELMNP